MARANVTNMNSMFSGCTSIETLDLSSFNTINVNNMSYMFGYHDLWHDILYGCTSLKTIYVSNNFVTTNVANSTDMFYKCNSLKGGNNTSYNSSNVDATYARIDTPSTPGYFTAK